MAIKNNVTCPASASADSSATPGHAFLASRPLRMSSTTRRHREPTLIHRRAAR
jgi:hypothetical protein